MQMLDRLTVFTIPDLGALALLLILWAGIGWRVEHSGARTPSTSRIMADYRSEWMRQMVTRDPRIFDAQIVATLRQGTSFFASTCVIAIGGAIALLGNAERLASVAEDITIDPAPIFIWEIKLLVLVLFLTNGFLKFAWANRLFGYCSVVMAAVPNDPDDPKAVHRAEQAAAINICAARSFNRGLRAVYFAFAAIAWLAGPEALACASVIATVIIWRREFASTSRKVLLKF